MRVKTLLFACCALCLSGCEGWPAHPVIYNPPTPPASRTPFIRTPTPLVLSPTPITITSTDASTVTPAESTETPTSGPTEITPTATLTLTPTSFPGTVKAEVLGCDTSIDLAHGMGEVTNAYVTISNSTASDLNDVCATLKGLDEGRPHPDKTKCLPSLAAGYQVTLKLTVDTTYKQQTPIQIDVNSGNNLLLRVGEASCAEIGLLPPSADVLGTPIPIP